MRDDRRIQGPNRARSMEILPWIHQVLGNLKTWLRGTFHGVSGKHLPRYRDEFVYRFDRRWQEGELFGFVLGRAVQGSPLPVQQQKLSVRPALHVHWQAARAFAEEYLLGLSIPEAPDHAGDSNDFRY